MCHDRSLARGTGGRGVVLIIGRMPARPTVTELYHRFGLEPLPEEGGLFRQTWAGGQGADGRPAGTAIIVLLAVDGGHFSALHRLPIDEVWFFQLGDPVELLLLHADGSSNMERLGPDVLGGHELQVVVPAGTWMGARVAPGGEWTLFATTMAPGFIPSDYEGGDPDELRRLPPACTADPSALSLTSRDRTSGRVASAATRASRP